MLTRGRANRSALFASACRFFGLRIAQSICHDSIGLRHAFSTQGTDRLTDWDPSRTSRRAAGVSVLTLTKVAGPSRLSLRTSPDWFARLPRPW
jgi:hypothetical protein